MALIETLRKYKFVQTPETEVYNKLPHCMCTLCTLSLLSHLSDPTADSSGVNHDPQEWNLFENFPP